MQKPRTERALGLAFTAYHRYRSVCENAIEGIFQMSPDGRYMGANPALARIYGYDSAEELQKHLAMPTTNFYVRHERRAEFHKLMVEDGMVSNFESEIFRKDGTTTWISESAVSIKDQCGEIVSYEGFVIDISEQRGNREELKQTRTDLKASLNELRITQAQAAETERLRTLGAMVNGIAHDFNNSLWMILGYGELLQGLCRTKPVAPEFTEYVETIVKASFEAVETISRLSDFHRSGELPGERVVLNLNDVIRKAIAFTRPRWEAEAMGRGTPINIVAELEPVDPFFASPAEMRDKFTHLIFNAVDAMPQGGTITIQTRMVGSQIQVSVGDTGIGMTPEVRRRCLEPFFTTKGGRSSGVGLAVVYGVAERHGGVLKIDTAPGRGACFTFSYPPGETAAPAEPAAPAQCRRPLRILAVDDHPVQTELLSHALGRDWHIVVTANNGRDALDHFESEYFDLVITDKAMPEMSGDQLAAAIKAREPSTPVIMLTGLGRPSDQDEDISEFVDVLIAKPASIKDLRAAITKLVG